MGTDLADLHQRSARGSLTEIYGDPCLAKHIREGDFLNLSLGRPGANIFSQGLEQAYGTPALAVETESGRLDGLLGTKDGLGLALFPPTAKPKDSFGLDPKALDRVRGWIAERPVLIYHFGNPYALDILGLHPRSNVVLAYQDFAAFQRNALEHFMGNHRALGRLPV